MAFFIQASTEDMVYRGYLTQFAAAFTRSPLSMLGIPAFVFSVPHDGNIGGSSGWPGLIPYVVMGLMYGWLAYCSGSLWMSAGVQLANNWFITMFVGSAAEKIPKIALFTTHGSASAAGARFLDGHSGPEGHRPRRGRHAQIALDEIEGAGRFLKQSAAESPFSTQTIHNWEHTGEDIERQHQYQRVGRRRPGTRAIDRKLTGPRLRQVAPVLAECR